MKVKIRNTIYDATYEPIMLILEDYDKKNILNMESNCKKLCVFPDVYSEEDIKKFMEIKL